MNLNQLISYFEENIKNAKKQNFKISHSTVAWQIDHSLKVINNVSKALIKSNPEEYFGNFSLTGKILIALNYFPRGKAKAPKGVQSTKEEIKTKDLIQAVVDAKSLVKKIDKLSSDSHFKHPIFGNLNLTQSKKFLRTHSNHHYKIIRDILK